MHKMLVVSWITHKVVTTFFSNGVLYNLLSGTSYRGEIHCSRSYWPTLNYTTLRRSLTKEAAATAIHAFITSRLDVCNLPLYGLPKVTLFQVQNSAARCLVVAK